MNGDKPRAVTWLPLAGLLVPVLVGLVAAGGRTYGNLERMRWQLTRHEEQPWHEEGFKRFQALEAQLHAANERLGRLEERVRRCEEEQARRK